MKAAETLLHIYPRGGQAVSILSALPTLDQLTFVERWARRGMAPAQFLRGALAIIAPVERHAVPGVLDGLTACIAAIGTLSDKRAA